MNAKSTADGCWDEHLDEVLGAYLAALDQGHAPEPPGLLASHPQLADGLTRFFADADRVTRWTAPLRTIVAAVRGQHAERLAPGICIGEYELLEEIGLGGMGIVYKARQRKLNRLVALKTISAGRFASAEMVKRFRNEAEAAAALDHPHIVPVHEVGECAGQLYFSMKLIEGGSLAQVLCGEPSAISQYEAAHLLVRVARAVHHAHQRGILHRDLKPSNILLDRRAGDVCPLIPYVADFGLAKRLTGDSELTHSGALLGTPSYMAPEIASPTPRVAATTAADVYGLGAILYALVTGRPPFKGLTPLDTLDLVRAGDPDPPSLHNAAVSPDLEAICLKCLEKEPSDRYGSADALADDLERFLEHRPIRALRPTLAQRMTKLARRHRSLVWALFGGLVLAVAVLAVSTGLIWQEKQRAEQAYQAEADARAAEAEQRRRAKANELRARLVVDDLYTKVAENWLATEPRMQLVQREILLKVVAFYESLLREHSTDPGIRFKTAQAYHFVGRLQARLGQRKEGAKAIRQQIALLRELVAEFPTRPRYRFDLFHSLRELAIAGLIQSHAIEAFHREAYQLIEQLVREFPGEPNYKDALSNQSMLLAELLLGRGKHEQAERAYRVALAMAVELTRAFPGKRTPPYYSANVATSLHCLGQMAQVRGRFREAEQLHRRALRVQSKLATDIPKEPGHWMVLGDYQLTLAMNLMETGQTAEAEELLDKSLALAEKWARRYPQVPRWPLHVANTRSSRGHAYLNAGDGQRAAEDYRAARATYEKLVADFPNQPDLKALCSYFLADCPLPRLRDTKRAVEMAEQAARDMPDLLTLGIVYYRAGKWAASMTHLEKAMQRRKEHCINAWFFMAMACWQRGEYKRAHRYFADGAEWMDKNMPYHLELRRHRAEAAALLGIKDKPRTKVEPPPPRSGGRE